MSGWTSSLGIGGRHRSVRVDVINRSCWSPSLGTPSDTSATAHPFDPSPETGVFLSLPKPIGSLKKRPIMNRFHQLLTTGAILPTRRTETGVHQWRTFFGRLQTAASATTAIRSRGCRRVFGVRNRSRRVTRFCWAPAFYSGSLGIRARDHRNCGGRTSLCAFSLNSFQRFGRFIAG
jgi:hypothetical protein